MSSECCEAGASCSLVDMAADEISEADDPDSRKRRRSDVSVFPLMDTTVH